MSRVVGIEKPLRFWPGQPNTWGKNPNGKPLYRVIWSESRFWMLGGEWPDGKKEYRWSPYYGGRKEWVLEKWLRPEEYAGSKEMWEIEYRDVNTGLYTMGPYPRQGWYEHCYSFPHDAEPNLEAIVPLLEYGKNNYTLSQIRTALHLWHDNKRKEWEQKVMDGMQDAMPAFGAIATNLSSSKPTMDTGGLTGHELKEAVRRHKGLPTTDHVEFSNLPQRGVSMGRRIVSTEE